jgi:hypothetical protein
MIKMKVETGVLTRVQSTAIQPWLMTVGWRLEIVV